MIALRSLLIILAASATSCASISQRDHGIKPGCAREALQAGNQRFIDGGMHAHSWHQERVVKTGEFGQSPSVGVLTCADSRTPPEIIFDEGIGDLFVVRTAGNHEDAGGTGTFEYGVAALGVHTILVLGHTKCGAVDATIAGKPLPGSMPTFTNAIAPALTGLASPVDLTAASEANVRYQINRLLEQSEILRTAKNEGKLTMLGGMYEVDTGRVRFLD